MVWALTNASQLSANVSQILENPSNQILVSPISFWEISLKYSLGKLLLEGITPEVFPSACLAVDFDILPLDPHIVATLHLLKSTHHKDPFDRMLIWQSILLKIPLISKDTMVAQYASEGLQVVWH
ncbi:MAG: type II toxin-antitoxin system VapC family toxin [Saprospiraceae bacterium]|nr:type II toxin-antitoxin system VapC family toxin [Saprospiraceae bacterium]